MGKSAYIKLVESSPRQELSLEDVKGELERYIRMTSDTGKQLGWEYASAAFPYTVEEKTTDGTRWLLLKGTEPQLYKHLVIGVGTATDEKMRTAPHIQVVVPTGATHGDTAKANEFCRYLARAFQAELHLFNGRVMYYYPRKP
ncbi:uncharacterized protein DUF1885 [Melghirimyces profundicolus]|uniref:Uncharacterized protein DUF1885 n=1 Tax=Melghirimyces profundicolus TaxID=1242148 RepID=A0A2T6C9U7_9BACL|nr:DUF1885 family protein [Melghirimyces profundicolus]PTX65053.1 uncharacterized protein DUF1885 [Melghirimyces profundicolus]